MKENWKDVSGNVLWQCCRPTSLMRIFFLSLFSRPKWPTLVFNDVVYLSGFFCGPTFFSVKTSNLVKNFPLQMSFFMLVIAVFLVGWIDNETRFFNFFLSRSLTPHSRFFLCPTTHADVHFRPLLTGVWLARANMMNCAVIYLWKIFVLEVYECILISGS